MQIIGLVPYNKVLPTYPDCTPLIRKGLIVHITSTHVVGYEEKDIYRLKMCLRDLKTKDHWCLFPDLLSFELICKMVHRAP